jgi:leucyl aminopeptidase
MQSLFTVSTDATPIQLLYTDDYPAWIKQQSGFLQNWLMQTAYDGKGFRIIPAEDGSIAQIVYGLEKESDFFIAGDLPQLLPVGQYRLADLPENLGEQEHAEFTKQFAITWGLAAYQYNRYKSSNKASAILALSDEQMLADVQKYIDAIFLVRDMINCPASDLMPQDISRIVNKLSVECSASSRHIVGEDLLIENFPTIHAVGRASIHEPRLIDMCWGDPDHPKVTLVGKGVCFDSGGLDLKPASAMRQMKKDMGGAAHVLGLASLIMQHKLPIRLRVLIPAVENAVSSNAFRPGDVIKTRQGLTVEIDNTDAEGRLVLCDALTEADSEQPDLIIDFATLTGACRVALGTELPGFFANNDDVAYELFQISKRVKDPIWQLPLHTPYQSMLKSEVADTLNSVESPFGGAITAALYLQLFVNKSTPWVHFDVMAWNNRKLPGRPIGGEAFGIRAVFEYLKTRYTAS